ncbi:ABC transporter substrate-binding protein [Paradevosia shaoguanensis]|uniref:ABC transporter substrate-binding protein n=1 Tax=Paradevosia shaoguanensis TaxID=1335043 RepID=UPI0019314BFD|nr:ABC transporter substrate-binding protein [Paradevosia shaoguanensis]
MTLKLRLHSLLLGTIASLCLGAPAALADLVNPPETVRVGLDVDSLSLDARLAAETTSYRLDDLLYDGLVRLDENFQPKPALATSWETPDPLTLIFHLREGVKFHNGQPLTADDVVFTYTTMVDPNLNARSRSLYEPIDGVTALDEHTVQFKLKEPYAPLFSYLDLGILPRAAAEGNAEFGSAPIGTGPFRFDSWLRGSQINLVANPDYWGGEPAVKKIEAIVVGNGSARAQAMEAGDLDLIYSPLPPAEVGTLSANAKLSHSVVPSVSFIYVNFNTADPLLSDPAMRTALAKLIDQATIVDQIYGGLDQAAASILMPAFPWAYDASVTQPTFDVEAAMAELDALGWKVGADGIRAKDGKQLALTIGTNSEDAERVQSIEYIQNVFTSAGIKTELQAVDYPTFMKGNQGKTYQISFLSWGNLVDPDRAMYGQLHTGGNFNWGSYSNPVVDAALEKGRSESAPEARAAAYKDAATQIAKDLPYYIVAHQRLHAFTSEKLKGFEPDARGFLTDLAAPAK